MGSFSKVLYALDNFAEPRTFERLCVDVLGREGYREIIPSGGVRDHGRDAEIRIWEGESGSAIRLAFQFSMEEHWERKLVRDASTIAQYCTTAKGLVFVTSQSVTGEKQDKLREQFRREYDWDLCIYDREWLRHRLEEVHQDLAKKHLDVDDLPETVCHVETLLDLHGLDEWSAREVFRDTTPENVKAAIVARLEKRPEDSKAWKRLALVEYHLRNYDEAFRAISSALGIDPDDVNLKLLKAAILAEQGIRTHSRVLLLQAKEIFQWVVSKLGRDVDHYNLANVLGALGENDAAEEHYRQSLKKEAGHAQTWKNLGSLLFRKGQHGEEMECYARALALKPDLVEAHLCKGTTLLVALNRPDEAVRCFEEAYALAPDLDARWGHARYWYATALFTLNQPQAALAQVEAGLSLAPDNSYLLNMKATLLSHLWHRDPSYEDAALAFFKFRVSAIQFDFGGLEELIQLLTRRGTPDDAWPFIDANLECAPFGTREIAERAGITLEQLRLGFSSASSYRRFREKYGVDDYFATMHEYGLTPNPIMEGALCVMLMAPFGHLRQEVLTLVKGGQLDGLKQAFESALADITRIFPAFGSYWLAPALPTTQERRVDLLSIGMAYLPDVIVAEASREFGYCMGCSGISPDVKPDIGGRDWRDVYTKLALHLLETVAKDWGLFRTS